MNPEALAKRVFLKLFNKDHEVLYKYFIQLNPVFNECNIEEDILSFVYDSRSNISEYLLVDVYKYACIRKQT